MKTQTMTIELTPDELRKIFHFMRTGMEKEVLDNEDIKLLEKIYNGMTHGKYDNNLKSVILVLNL